MLGYGRPLSLKEWRESAMMGTVLARYMDHGATAAAAAATTTAAASATASSETSTTTTASISSPAVSSNSGPSRGGCGGRQGGRGEGGEEGQEGQGEEEDEEGEAEQEEEEPRRHSRRKGRGKRHAAASARRQKSVLETPVTRARRQLVFVCFCEWRGVAWRGVAWRGAAWRGVERRGGVSV